MICPHCTGKKLQEIMTRKGVLVDHCNFCGGTWLDKGELFFFTRNRRRMARALLEAIREAKQGDRPSPKTGRPMMEIALFAPGLVVDYCEDTEGLWFDHKELERLLDHDKGLEGMVTDRSGLAGDKTQKRYRVAPGKPLAGKDEELKLKKRMRLEAIAARVTPLPNLVGRSVFTLTGLFALLCIVLIAASLHLGLPPGVALLIGVVIAALQFLVGPFLMDLSLNWIYRMSWVERSRLPDHLVTFLDRICAENKMKFPRIGLIHDGAPNAFTYGHTPNNARIVITQGILDLLSPEEAEAVVAHEMGHAAHWDMALMTMANLVPLVLYFVYRTLITMRGGDRGKGAGVRVAVAVGAYLIYLLSQYVVLWFSRTREYYADRFSGEAMKNPNALASALVRIAYGLAGREGDRKKGDKKKGEGRSSNLEALGALGIFNTGAARALAVTSMRSKGGHIQGEVDKEHLIGAMRWDRWNPWAKYYEIHSTHPLVANRLEYLGEQSAAMGEEPFVVFTERRPESYWDEFLVDLVVMWLPVLLALPMLMIGLSLSSRNVCFGALAGLGLGMLLKNLFSYRGGAFPAMDVASLLRYVKVSAVRPIPCTLEGTVIGRGVPGLIWSEDFVMQDDTGILFLDYRQPLRLWEFLFGLLRRETLANQKVRVTGWYRRNPVPYLELKTMEGVGRKRTCYVYHMKIFFSALLFVAGIVLMAAL